MFCQCKFKLTLTTFKTNWKLHNAQLVIISNHNHCMFFQVIISISDHIKWTCLHYVTLPYIGSTLKWSHTFDIVSLSFCQLSLSVLVKTKIRPYTEDFSFFFPQCFWDAYITSYACCTCIRRLWVRLLLHTPIIILRDNEIHLHSNGNCYRVKILP